jgi:hypothetical protein
LALVDVPGSGSAIAISTCQLSTLLVLDRLGVALFALLHKSCQDLCGLGLTDNLLVVDRLLQVDDVRLELLNLIVWIVLILRDLVLVLDLVHCVEQLLDLLLVLVGSKFSG